MGCVKMKRALPDVSMSGVQVVILAKMCLLATQPYPISLAYVLDRKILFAVYKLL